MIRLKEVKYEAGNVIRGLYQLIETYCCDENTKSFLISKENREIIIEQKKKVIRASYEDPVIKTDDGYRLKSDYELTNYIGIPVKIEEGDVSQELKFLISAAKNIEKYRITHSSNLILESALGELEIKNGDAILFNEDTGLFVKSLGSAKSSFSPSGLKLWELELNKKD